MLVMLGIREHTLLGNIVYVGPRATHFTGYCSFLCIIVDLMWGPQQWTFNNLNYNSQKACFRISAETAEAILPQSHIHKLAPSPKPVRGRVYASNI
jgi:hypothetical protein